MSPRAVNDRPYNQNITCFTNKGEFTKKKFVAVLSAAAMMTTLAACGSTASSAAAEATASAAESTADTAAKSYKVAIVQTRSVPRSQPRGLSVTALSVLLSLHWFKAFIPHLRAFVNTQFHFLGNTA